MCYQSVCSNGYLLRLRVRLREHRNVNSMMVSVCVMTTTSFRVVHANSASFATVVQCSGPHPRLLVFIFSSGPAEAACHGSPVWSETGGFFITLWGSTTFAITQSWGPTFQSFKPMILHPKNREAKRSSFSLLSVSTLVYVVLLGYEFHNHVQPVLFHQRFLTRRDTGEERYHGIVGLPQGLSSSSLSLNRGVQGVLSRCARLNISDF